LLCTFDISSPVFEQLLCTERSGVNFINVLRAAFTLLDPKSVKMIDTLTVFFTLLGTLMKLSPGVNFINVWRQKLQICILALRLFGANILYKKHARKTLMKSSAVRVSVCVFLAKEYFQKQDTT